MFFRDLWSSLSEESRTLIRAAPGNSGAGGWGTGEDPNELWGAIRRTHFTLENAGEGAAMEKVNLLMKLKTLEQLKQTPGMSVAEFLRDYLELVASAEEAGMPVDDEVKFLYKLDPARHGAMLLQLKNEALRGNPYPPTVPAAYTLAST